MLFTRFDCVIFYRFIEKSVKLGWEFNWNICWIELNLQLYASCIHSFCKFDYYRNSVSIHGIKARSHRKTPIERHCQTKFPPQFSIERVSSEMAFTLELKSFIKLFRHREPSNFQRMKILKNGNIWWCNAQFVLSISLGLFWNFKEYSAWFPFRFSVCIFWNEIIFHEFVFLSLCLSLLLAFSTPCLSKESKWFIWK